MAELLSGVAEIFGLPSLTPSLPLSVPLDNARDGEEGAKRRNEKIARKIINLREKESWVASGSKGEYGSVASKKGWIGRRWRRGRMKATEAHVYKNRMEIKRPISNFH